MYKIGKLAELAECQPVTVRYYEKEGLLAKPSRGENGYREYGNDDLERLRFIRHCRDHGIALADVKILLKLRNAPEGDCGPVDDMVTRLIDQLDEQLKSIKKLKKNLVTLKGRCHGGSIADCAILKSLSDRDNCACAPVLGVPVEAPGGRP
ncbi:MAG: MerR family transcriptional regulator [Deltaproteobacteria bacterium]|jgi:DNA-binding transcriptional MerR regulator|nr:MerR family transcriptional regulator [Deltaproteobacteria bacterium]